MFGIGGLSEWQHLFQHLRPNPKRARPAHLAGIDELIF
jgi:hypothetical protein